MNIQSSRELSPDQARQLAALAERTRTTLVTFAAEPVQYDVTALQLLDEWVEFSLRQDADLTPETRLLWAIFLGETFRRQNAGLWILQELSNGEKILAVSCPLQDAGNEVIDVSGQVNRRIDQGIAASLTYFYRLTSIRLKQPSHDS